MPEPAALTESVTMRVVAPGDGDALAEAYARNREHLAPWEPVRPDAFFTPAGQDAEVASKLGQLDAGTAVPWLLCDGDRVVGTLTVSGIVRGPFLSGNVGYWVDRDHVGRGIATAAVEHAARAAREQGLHRLQAGTLVHNVASQKVLRRAGFERIGLATQYLHIAGRWQDHVLFERILP
jgi:[ribosomal protein S5]-alanine N-acetyltransferase